MNFTIGSTHEVDVAFDVSYTIIADPAGTTNSSQTVNILLKLIKKIFKILRKPFRQ